MHDLIIKHSVLANTTSTRNNGMYVISKHGLDIILFLFGVTWHLHPAPPMLHIREPWSFIISSDPITTTSKTFSQREKKTKNGRNHAQD